MNRFHNISLATDVSCLLLCTVGIMIIAIWYKAIGKSSKYSISIFATLLLSVLSNLLGLTFKGGTAPYTHTLLVITNFMEFASEYMLSYAKARGNQSLFRNSILCRLWTKALPLQVNLTFFGTGTFKMLHLRKTQGRMFGTFHQNCRVRRTCTQCYQ